MADQAQILIGGREVTPDFAPAMNAAVRQMEQRKDSVFLPPHMSALRLRTARSGSELGATYADLLRYRHHVNPAAFFLPPARNLRERVLNGMRRLLWKVLRYQHERLFFRQNLINSHFTGLLDLQARELQALRAEVESLRPGKDRV
jgi:hypothetical protein